MFYNVMRSAISQGHYLEDVFGDQSGYYKHALVKASRFCDGIFAVGDYVLKEIRFLGPDFRARRQSDRLQRRSVLEDQRRRSEWRAGKNCGHIAIRF